MRVEGVEKEMAGEDKQERAHLDIILSSVSLSISNNNLASTGLLTEGKLDAVQVSEDLIGAEIARLVDAIRNTAGEPQMYPPIATLFTLVYDDQVKRLSVNDGYAFLKRDKLSRAV